MSRAIAKAVRRWNVITDRPTTSGSMLAHQPLDGARHVGAGENQIGDGDAVMGSMLPASDASAPFGIRIATGGVCSNESGIDSSRTFTETSEFGRNRRRPRIVPRLEKPSWGRLGSLSPKPEG